MKSGTASPGWGSERGVSLVMVGLALLVLLGVVALAIDLGMLYVARNEAQRAADAAALAGASRFDPSGCLTAVGGCVAGGVQEEQARQQAIAIAGQNAILRLPATVQPGDVSFAYPNPQDPQITVKVYRTAERGTSIPTIFARMFHVFAADVSAMATAEAFPASINTCLVPFLVPNCDPSHTVPLNSFCTSFDAGPFVNTSDGSAVHPGASPAGVYGESWQLHFGAGPGDSAVPSQWYMLAMGASQSASELRQFISQCYPQPVKCGDILQTYNGKSVGPINQGVMAKIHASGLGMGRGQDTIDPVMGPPFTITGGTWRTDGTAGRTISGVSPSVVTVPIYDGHPLSPGGEQVTVVGFMEMFIQDVEHTGIYDVANAIIMNITGCNQSGGGGTATGTPIAIRLIRQ